MAAASLDELLAARAAELRLALDRTRLHPLGRPWDAELRKVLCGLLGGVADARRLQALGVLDDAARRRLEDVLAGVSPRMSLDVALESIDALEAALVDHGDETYLYGRLRSEHRRSPRAARERATSALVAADVLADDELQELLHARRWTEEQAPTHAGS